MSAIEPHKKKLHHYAEVFENSTDVIYLIEVTPEGRFIHLDINPAFIEASGMAKEEILGHYVDEFENESYRTILLDKYTSCLKAGGKTVYINDYLLPTGIHTFHSLLTPLCDETGRIHQIVGIARDITEQKRMESVLASRENKFRSLAENTPDNIARWDTEGRYLYINPVHERTLGMSVDEAVGTHIPDAHTEVIAAIKQVCETGESVLVRQMVPMENGETEYHNVNLVPERDTSGNIISILGVGRNMTQLYRLQDELATRKEEYRTLMANSPDHIMRLDTQGRYLYLNPIHERTFGMSASEVIGKPKEELFPEHTAVLDAVERIVSMDEEEITVEQLVPGVNGAMEIHEVKLMAEKNTEGKIVSILGIGRDITERKRAEEALQQAVEFNEEIINTIPDLLFELDAEGIYLNIWAQDETLLAAQKAILIGNNVRDILSPDAVEVTFNTMKEVDEMGQSLGNTMYIDLPEGRKYFELSASMKKSSGTYIVLSRDITDRKVQEERLHKTKAKLAAVISTIPDLIWVKDAEGVYMMCNSTFENFFGAEGNEIIGKTDYDFISPEQADFFRQKDREAMESGEMRINEEEIVFAHNGERALLETRKIPVYNGEEFMGVLGIGRDITERKKMESEINKQKDFQHTLLLGIAEAGLGVHVIKEGKYIYTNDIEKAKKYGYDETIMDVKPSFIETIHPDDRSKALDMYTRRLRGEDVPSSYELAVLQTDGAQREHSVSVIVIPNTDPIQTIVVTQDITERKAMEEMMIQNESRLKEAQKIAKVGSWELEFPGLNLHWSDEIFCIFEIDPDKFQPSYEYFLNAIHPEDRLIIDTAYNNSLKNKTPYDIVHRLLMSDGRIKYVHERGETFFDEEGNPIRSIGTVQDITEQKVIEKKMEHIAHHDALTGLPNRILAKKRAEQIIAHAKHSESQAAFLFIDLDGFKAINDTLGHSAGDSMLKTIASRLKECIRENDILSRQGGDEFLLILSDLNDENIIASTAQKVLSELEKSFEINDHTLSISGSIGISLYPDHGETFELLLKSADTAMYKAKETGKNGYHFYTQQMTHNIIGQFKIKNDLKNALENGEFTLFYQPQIDLSTNRITGVEALIRWEHPIMGMMPPMSFIPIAESSGLIVPIGQWVIEEACRQAALWHRMGMNISVAVNISAMQFKRGNLEEIVENALHTSQINPKWLELELTESIIMHDADNTLQSVRNLKALGVQLSIDDFGTGYSSLSYLKRFAVDKLKIDQSFVRDILQDREDAAIVKTIIHMAKNLNLKTIAEGVENAQVLSVIDAYGCDEVQGYHFAKPMRSSELELYYSNFYKSEA